MKVYYPENPLKISYAFTNLEKKLYEANVRSYVKDDMECEIWGLLDEGKIEEAKEKSCPEVFEQDVNKETERLLGYLWKELEEGYSHGGDCTKFCCSCSKCWAEGFIEGFKPYTGILYLDYLYHAFEENRTLNQAIQWLEEYNPEPREDGYHLRWMSSAKDSLEWLKEYKKRFNLEGNGGSVQGVCYDMGEEGYEEYDWL